LNRVTVQEKKEVVVLWGPPGTGDKPNKSGWAYVNYPDLYSKPEGQWWNGYDYQETVLLDDFNPHDIPYTQLLKITDRYPVQVPYKGGFKWLKAKRIIITSNQDPKYWYYNMEALNRRITSCRYIEPDSSN